LIGFQGKLLLVHFSLPAILNYSTLSGLRKLSPLGIHVCFLTKKSQRITIGCT
jgi:hypothetical protein